MSEKTDYVIPFTIEELESLRECLTVLRKRIDEEYQESHPSQRIEPVKQPIFVAACELQFKIAKIVSPDINVTIQDYLDYGTYGDKT